MNHDSMLVLSVFNFPCSSSQIHDSLSHGPWKMFAARQLLLTTLVLLVLDDAFLDGRTADVPVALGSRFGDPIVGMM